MASSAPSLPPVPAPPAAPVDSSAEMFRMFSWGLAAVFFYLAWRSSQKG